MQLNQDKCENFVTGITIEIFIFKNFLLIRLLNLISTVFLYLDNAELPPVVSFSHKRPLFMRPNRQDIY